MIDIDSIDREIRLAHLELNDPTNVKGILPLAVRKRIWEAMLEPEDTEGTYRRRTSLRILCVEHVKVLDEIDDFDSVTEPASFVADAASSTVISACHRCLEYDIANSAEEDDERLPDALDTSYCCASAAAKVLN